MHTNNMSSRPTKSWVYVQLEKKEKEKKVLKYFRVGNRVIFIMELRGRIWKYFKHKFSLKVMRLISVYFFIKLLNYV